MRKSSIKRITAVLAAAILAASTLTFQVSAVYDPLTGEQFEGTYGVDYVRDPVTKRLYNLPEVEGSGFSRINGIMMRNDSTGVHPYTGMISVNGEVRYYDTGIAWLGWRKLGGKWYYFDPDNKGLMATEQAVTAAGIYYLDEDGAWNGNLTRETVMPDNFAFILRESSYGSGFEMNIGKKSISSWENSAKVQFSRQDKQIIYDMVLTFGLDEMEKDMKGRALAKRAGETLAENTDIPTYYIAVRMGEETYVIHADQYTYTYYDKDASVNDLARFIIFADRYAETLPQYKQVMR